MELINMEGSTRLPLVFDAASIRLDGTSIVGQVRVDRALQPIPLVLAIDGQRTAAGELGFRGGRGAFRIPIPAERLDGLPHFIEVEVDGTGQRIGAIAEILPSIATPWTSLHQYASEQLPIWFAPAARHRYQSLSHWLRATSDCSPPDLARHLQQLSLTHDILVRGFTGVREFRPFAFRHVETPTVSVVVPAHNHVAATYCCLASLYFAFNETPFEVIVVDDGSTDETVSLPEIVTGVTYLRNDRPRGFVRACNRGAAAARGDYVAFLNNDTETTAGWLDELQFVFKKFEDVGLAGSKLLFPDGRLQEAGGIVWGNGNPWNYGRNGNPEDPRYTYTRQVDYVSGAALMVSRDVWEAVGEFSEEFCPAYFEDTDLAFKTRAIGKKVVYAPQSVVYHVDGLSADDAGESRKRTQDINKPTFKRRWVFAYQQNGAEGHQVDLAKDRNVPLRALVIDHQVPRPDQDAGSYAAIQEMRLLQSLGCKVTFLPLNFAHLGGYTTMLQRLGVECIHAPFATSVQEFLTERGSEFDLIYITRYTAARQVLEDVRRLAPQARVLFCTADLHFLRMMRGAIAERDPHGIKQAKAVRAEELRIMGEVDVVLSYSSVEHAIIQSHNFDRTPVVTAPWVVDVIENPPGFAERKDIAFLGGFGHPPNLLAVRYFVNDVMPLLREQLPGVRFRVFGSSVPDELRSMACDDVLIVGYVADVGDVYDQCRVFVAPLLSGAGLKGKVVDCLAHGTPAVLSPIAAEGIGLRPGVDAVIAETPLQWVDAIRALYTDPAAWQAMSEQARTFASETYSFERGRRAMAEALSAAGIAVPRSPRALVAKEARVERLARLPRPAENQEPDSRSGTEAGGSRIVSPDFRPTAGHLLTQPLPPHEHLVLVPDSDVGPILTDSRDKEIGGWLRDRRTWAQAEGRFLRNVLKPGMNAIDIGANIGYFTLLCAHAIGPTGRVLAIEAEPEFVLQLRENVALNALQNVEVLPVAAHRQSGMMAVWRNSENFGGSFVYPADADSSSPPIQAVRLDDVLNPGTPIDVIKIDIEGMDHAAVHGLQRTIRRWRPIMLVEYHPLAIELFGENPVDVLKYYRSLDLQISVLGTDAVRLRDYAGLALEDLVHHDLRILENLDARIAELTHPIGLINLVLTPLERMVTAARN
jgi:FkbM family methyltransferase